MPTTPKKLENMSVSMLIMLQESCKGAGLSNVQGASPLASSLEDLEALNPIVPLKVDRIRGIWDLFYNVPKASQSHILST